MRLLLDRALQSKVKAKINFDLLPFQCKSLRCMVCVINGTMSSGPSERIWAEVVKKVSQKLNCNGQFPFTLICSPWLWKPCDLDDHLHLAFYDLCDIHHIPDHPYLIFVISFTLAGFSKTKFYTKKTNKGTKTLKMSLKKSNICIFFHSIWKNLHLTENFYTDMSVVSVTNKLVWNYW